MVQIFRLLSRYSLLGLIRYFRLRITGRELLVTGSCNSCGNCCRKINLEGHRGWLRREEDFAVMLQEYPEYERFRISGKDDMGFLQFSCSWLTDEGICRDHDSRLPLCRNFPDKTLHFCGGTVPPGCGYLINEVRPFSSYLAETRKKGEKR